MDTFSSQSNMNAISVRAGRRSGLTFVDKEQISMPGSPRPYRVHQPRTIRDLELRRRQLRKEFEELKAVPRPDIEEAEIVEDAP